MSPKLWPRCSAKIIQLWQDESTSSYDPDNDNTMMYVEEREDSAVAAVETEKNAAEQEAPSEPSKGSSDKKKKGASKSRGRSKSRRGSKKGHSERGASPATSSSKFKKSSKSKSSKKKKTDSKKSSVVSEESTSPSEQDGSSNTLDDGTDEAATDAIPEPISDTMTPTGDEAVGPIVESEPSESSADTESHMPAGQSSTEQVQAKETKSEEQKPESPSGEVEIGANVHNDDKDTTDEAFHESEVKPSDAPSKEVPDNDTREKSSNPPKKKQRSSSRKGRKTKTKAEAEPTLPSIETESDTHVFEDGEESSESHTHATDHEISVSEAEPEPPTASLSRRKKKRSSSPKKKHKDKRKSDRSVSSDAAVVSMEGSSSPTAQSTKSGKSGKVKKRATPVPPGVQGKDDVWPVVKQKSKRKILQEEAETEGDPLDRADEEEASTIVVNGKTIKVNPAPKLPAVKTKAQLVMEEIEEQRKTLRQIGLSSEKSLKSNIFDSKGNIFDHGEEAPKSPGRGRRKQFARFPPAGEGTPSSSRSEKPYLQLDVTSLGPAPDLGSDAPPRRGLTKTFSDLFQRSGSHKNLREMEKEPQRGRIRRTSSAKQLFGGGIEKLFRGNSDRGFSKDTVLDRRGQMMKKGSSEAHFSKVTGDNRAKMMKRLASDSDVLRKPANASSKKKAPQDKAHRPDDRSHKMKKGQSEPNVKKFSESPKLLKKGHSESNIEAATKSERRSEPLQSEPQRSSIWSLNPPEKRGMFRNKSDQNLLGKEKRRGFFRGGSTGRLFKSNSDRAVASPPLARKDSVEVKLIKPLDLDDDDGVNSSELWAGTRLRKSKAKEMLYGSTEGGDSSSSSDSGNVPKNWRGSPTNRPNEESRMRSLFCDVWSKNKKDAEQREADLPKVKRKSKQSPAIGPVVVLAMVALMVGKVDAFALSISTFRDTYNHKQGVTSHSHPARSCSTTACAMSLIPLNVDDVQDLISVGTAPTASQYTAYWGRTPRERYSRLVETFLVSILGMVFSYTLSFVLGGFVATILGAVFLFWGVFTPQLQAAQRNWEFLGGRELVDWYEDQKGLWFDQKGRGLLGALFLGRLADICVVEYAAAPPEEEYDLLDFQDYTMETDDLEQYTGNSYLLRVRLEDSEGRELQVHARLSEEYLDLEPGMEVVSLLLSKSTDFDQLAALTDLYVPATETYIGDYPYLHRDGIENLLAMDDEIWQALQQESGYEAIDSDFDDVVVEEEEDGAYWESRSAIDADDADGDGKKAASWQPSEGYSNRDSSSRKTNQRTVPVGRRARGRRRYHDDYEDL